MQLRRGMHLDASARHHNEARTSFETHGHTAPAGTHAFYWSHRRLRRLARIVAALALLTAPLMLSHDIVIRSLCLGWFIVLACCATGLARRMASREPVLTIDRVGLCDRRTFDSPVFWQDVRILCRCHPSRCHVLELFLLHPQRSTANQKAWTRLGGRLQRGFGVPAVSINLWLLDADAPEVLAAIARFRPGLIPRGMLA